jgi:hypothetical protein
LIEKIFWVLTLGVDASAVEEVFGVREEDHGAAEHSNVTIEKPLGNDEKNSIDVEIAGSMMSATVKPAI